jgi:hypothetical protein
MMTWERPAVLTAGTVCFFLGAATIALLESPLFRPDYPTEASRDHETDTIRFPGPARERGGM